jgi:hypothetical protein
VRRTGPAALTAFAVLGLLGAAAGAGGSAAAGAAAAATATPAPSTAPATAVPPLATAGGLLTRSAHVAFGNCGARDVVLTVSVAKSPFVLPLQRPVTYEARLTNDGGTACGPGHPTSPPFTGNTLSLGPCGPLPAVVSDASGVDVYPGSMAFFCPMFVDTYLGPHATVAGVGTWEGYEALGPPGQSVQWRQAPPGAYHVTVGKAVTVPFMLAQGAPGAPGPVRPPG